MNLNCCRFVIFNDSHKCHKCVVMNLNWCRFVIFVVSCVKRLFISLIKFSLRTIPTTCGESFL